MFRPQGESGHNLLVFSSIYKLLVQEAWQAALKTKIVFACLISPFLLKRRRRAVIRQFQSSGSFDTVMTNIVQRECRVTSGATLSSPLYFKFTSDDLFERSSELSAVEAVQDRIGCGISKDNQLRELPQFIAFVDVKIP